MSWMQINDGNVTDEFAPAEVALITSLQAKSKLPEVLTKVVEMVRGKIVAAGGRLGPEGTVPVQVHTEVIDVARWRWLVSLPSLARLQTKERKELHDEAMKAIRRIETGDVKVEAPDSTEAAPKVTSPSPRIVERESYGGVE